MVFGLPGGPISPLNDALIDSARIQNVTARHENGAIFAAIGHARVTGRVGVALVTSGPGILNGMCALASAHCDGVPLVVLVGEVPRRVQGRNALQDGSAHHLDIRGMVRSISKDGAEVTDPRTAGTLISRAFRLAREGRPGPVVVTIPMDVLTAEAQVAEVTLNPARLPSDRSPTLPRSVMLALERSQTGLIFAGAGARGAGGPRALRKLAERLQWPVMTTPKGKGVFPEDHPLALGVFGAGGHRSTHDYLRAGVETVLAVGTSLGDLATDGWSELLAPNRTFIHVDLDAANISANYDVSMFVEASVAEFCDAACARLPRPGLRTTQSFGGLVTHRDPEASDVGPNGTITPERAIWEIQLAMEEDARILVDSGEHYLYAVHYLRLNHSDAFIAQSGLGAMGASIGAGLGAQLGTPSRRTLVICGDGGFVMAGNEVATAARLGSPVLYFVFDDQRLGMVENGHGDLYGRTPRFTPEPVDLAAFARSMGAGSARVSLPGEIMKLDYSRLTDRGRRPGVVVVSIDPDCRMPRNTRTTTMANEGVG